MSIRSTLGDERLTYERLERDVQAVLSRLEIRSSAVLGFNDGGVVCYRLALSGAITDGPDHDHRLTVDAYAVQHAGEPSPQATRSVWLHLMSLHAVLELGLSAGQATELIRANAHRSDLPWLEPPPEPQWLTVDALAAAQSAEEHVALAWQWARSAWAGWAHQQDRIRAWSAGTKAGREGR